MALKKLSKKFLIKRMNLTDAGSISSYIKKELTKLGVDPRIIRRIAIASYEAEINVVIHSYGGYCLFTVDPKTITLEFVDSGPGIVSIPQAMQSGFSTASDVAKTNGFGAGMGLPNIKNASDEFDIKSSDKGTKLTIKFKV